MTMLDLFEKKFRIFFTKTFTCNFSLPAAIQSDNTVSSLREHQQDIEDLWSEFDSNLLEELIDRLTSPTDHARFRAVCKAWLEVRPVKSSSPALLPWFLGFDCSVPRLTGNLELMLYEPSSGPHSTSVYTIKLDDLSISAPAYWYDTTARCISNWLFFTIRRLVREGPERRLCYRRNFVVFSPFTKQVIQLPQLDYPSPFEFTSHFSGTDPNSGDCVFLLADTRCVDSTKIAIATYRNGDKEWSTRQFDRVDEFRPCECFPIYFRGMVYLVSPFGQMAAYDIRNGEFWFESLVRDNQFFLSHGRKHEVFELNGELVLIYFGFESEKTTYIAQNPCIKRFDWSSKVWVPLSSLGDQSLFVGQKFKAVAVVKERQNGVLPNKVYYFSASGCMVYSLKNSDLVEHKFFSSNFTNPSTANYHLANSGELLRPRGSSWLERLLRYMNPKIPTFFWLTPPAVIYGNNLS